jgi:hypothetical protein
VVFKDAATGQADSVRHIRSCQAAVVKTGPSANRATTSKGGRTSFY